MDTPLKLHNGQIAEKNQVHSFIQKEALRPPILFLLGRHDMTHFQDGATTPFCFGSMVEELESSHGLLLYLYHILHRFFWLLKKELIWITGYHNFTAQTLTDGSCHQQIRVLSGNHDQEADYGVQTRFRLEDNHHGVLESFQKQNLIIPWFWEYWLT